MNPEQQCDHCRVSLVPDQRAAPGPGAGGPGLPVSTAQLYCPKIILVQYRFQIEPVSVSRKMTEFGLPVSAVKPTPQQDCGVQPQTQISAWCQHQQQHRDMNQVFILVLLNTINCLIMDVQCAVHLQVILLNL